MEQTTEKQFEMLQKLWVSGDLEKVERSIDRFNLFSALKLDNMEIRHSNFLAWLMNPRESHEIGDYFLKEFFKVAIKDFLKNEKINIKPNDFLNKRFYECEIRREDNNIDILIINPETKFVCVIENKIWSGEGNGQLKKYAEYVEKQFKGYKKLHIFLTPDPNPEDPLLERGNAFYIQMGYEQVVDAIEKTLKHRGHIVSDDVRIFIAHYKKMIERNIMGKIDKDVMDFCRGLYRNHKDAIDLINRCTANIDKEIDNIFNEIIDNHNCIKTSRPDALYFLPKDVGLNYGSDKDWLNGNIVGLYFSKRENEEFKFGISVQSTSPANSEKRAGLIKALEEEFKPFNGSSDNWSWMQLETIMTVDKYCELNDSYEAKKYIEQEIKTTIDKFNEVLKKASMSSFDTVAQ